MEKVIRTRNHDYRQLLRSCPIEHIRERHSLVPLAMDDDGVCGHVLSGVAAPVSYQTGGRCDQHEAAHGDALGDARLDEGAEVRTETAGVTISGLSTTP